MDVPGLDAGRVHELLFSVGRSVGVVFTLVLVGGYLARSGTITEAGKKVLSEVSMRAATPALLFTKLLACPQCGKDGQDPNATVGCERCPSLETLLRESWILLFAPFIIVGLGLVLGVAVVRCTGCPKDFDRGCIASVAFGNSTGMPIILLSVIYDSLKGKHLNAMVDPVRYLPCYLIIYPMLQWSIGSWLFGVGDQESKALELPTLMTSTFPTGEKLLPLSLKAPSLGAAPPEAGATGGGATAGDKGVQAEAVAGADCKELRLAIAGAPQEAPAGPAPAVAGPGERRERLEDPTEKRRCRLPSPPSSCCYQLCSPPVVATLLALAIGLCPYPRPYGLRSLLLDLEDQDGDAPVQWAFESLSRLGDAAVPINMLLLGATLASGGALKELPMRVNVLVAVAKMLVLPILVSLLVSVLRRHLLTSGDPKVANAIWLVAVTVSCTPTANNINSLAQLGQQNSKALGAAIFLQYLCAPLFVTLSLSGFIATTPEANS